MFAQFNRHLGFAVLAPFFLALSLGLSMPALAQQSGNGMPPANGAESDHGGWGNESFEKQEFREEMEQIRKEHEDIVMTRDKLKEQCEHATGAEAQNCEAQKAELHARMEKLHERKRNLHEKMQAEHQAHPENGMHSAGMPNGDQ